MSDFSRSGGVCTTKTARRGMGRAVRGRIRTGTETNGRTEGMTGVENSTIGPLLDLEVHRGGTNDPIRTTDRHIMTKVRFFKIYKISSFP